MVTRFFKYILLLLLVYASSCQNATHKFESDIAAAKGTLTNRTAEERQVFEDSFKSRRKIAAETENVANLDSLYGVVTTTNLFLDSVRSVLDKLDPNDLDYVRENLIGTLGDSLFKKVKYALGASFSFARKEQQKHAIDSIFSNVFENGDPEKWKTEYFGRTSSFGASMIIHGLGIEVFKAAEVSIEE